MPARICRFINHINSIIEKVFIVISGLLLLFMVVITCANIICRWVSTPLRGTFELMGLSSAVVAAFALAYTQRNKEHISVDIVTKKFPVKIQKILGIVNDCLCIAFSIIATWQVMKIAAVVFNSGEVTETLRIIYYPFIYAVAVGFAALSLIFLADIISALFGDKEAAQ